MRLRLLNFIKNRLSFFANNCSFFNKFFTIKIKSDEFNTCSCSCHHDEICALGTQCKVSALVFNYIFGEPSYNFSNKNVNEMIDLIKNIENNSYIHFMIAVHSIYEFVGHRFIILALKENEQLYIFKIQSYVNSYTTKIDEIAIDDLETEMRYFISMFEKPNIHCPKTSSEDCIFWKKFTYMDLPLDVEIPNYIHVFKYFLSEKNLNIDENFTKLKNRIKKNIKDLIENSENLLKVHKQTSRLLERTLGISNKQQQKIDSILDKIIQISKNFKTFNQNVTQTQNVTQKNLTNSKNIVQVFVQ